MSIPAAITPITVTGTFIAADGSPQRGYVHFTPSIVAKTPGAVMPKSRLSVRLDADGELSVPLASTDDPQWSAPGFTYRVVEEFSGAEDRAYWIEVPAASSGGNLDLTEAPHVNEDGS